MTDFKEGQLNFSFSDEYKAVKFDDTAFYKRIFQSYMPQGKGLDFIAYSSSRFIMLEIKDFTDHERDNEWRTHLDSSYIILNENNINKPIKVNEYKIEESLDIEVAKKVSSSIACLLGANSQSGISDADILKPYAQELTKTKIASGNSTLIVMLFVEGVRESKTRTKKMIMSGLQNKLKHQLKWLNCKVTVIDLETCNGKYVTVSNV